MAIIKEPTAYQEANRQIQATVVMKYLQLSNYNFSNQISSIIEVGGLIIKSPTQGIIKSGYEVSSDNSERRKSFLVALEPNIHYGSIGDFKLDSSTYLARYEHLASNPNCGFFSDWFWNGEKFITNQNGTYWESTTLSLLIPIDQYLDEIQLSIMFKNGYPKNLKIKPTLYSSESEYLEINDTNHDDYFTENGTLIIREPLVDYGDYIILEMSNWSEANQRPVIANLYMGVVMEYTNEEIISISSSKSIDLLNRETPAGACTVELVNHGDFDILNPKSFIPYLNKNVVIEIYYKTLGGTLSWQVDGYYYLNNWKNTDESTIFYGEGYLSRITDVCMSDFDSTNFLACYNDANKFSNWLFNEYAPYGSYKKIIQVQMANGVFSNIGDSVSYVESITERNFLKWLQKFAFWCCSYIREWSSKGISFYKIRTTPSETEATYFLRIEDQEGEEVKITKTDKIRKLTISSSKVVSQSEMLSTPETFTIEAYVPTDSDIVEFDPYPYYITVDDTISIVDEDNQPIINFEKAIAPKSNVALKISNASGKKVSITITAHYKNNLSSPSQEEKYVEEFMINPEGVDLYYEKPTGGNYGNADFIERVEKILSCDKTFEVDTFGDPLLSLGDNLFIETKYGNIFGILTSIDTKYDGGLRSTLKGLIIDD